jgi:hypothetical protein
MTRRSIAMLAALVHQWRRGDRRPAPDGWVLVIPAPPGVTLEEPLIIGGDKSTYIAGLRRLRGEVD